MNRTRTRMVGLLTALFLAGCGGNAAPGNEDEPVVVSLRLGELGELLVYGDSLASGHKLPADTTTTPDLRLPTMYSWQGFSNVNWSTTALTTDGGATPPGLGQWLSHVGNGLVEEAGGARIVSRPRNGHELSQLAFGTQPYADLIAAVAASGIRPEVFVMVAGTNDFGDTAATHLTEHEELWENLRADIPTLRWEILFRTTPFTGVPLDRDMSEIRQAQETHAEREDVILIDVDSLPLVDGFHYAWPEQEVIGIAVLTALLS